MNLQLAVTPAGRVIAVELATDGDEQLASSDPVTDQKLEKRIARQFASSQAEGIFALASERMDRPNPSFAYWRDFGERYLTELCHTPEIAGAAIKEVPPPSSTELSTMLWNVPPLQGAEYLTERVLCDIWTDLDVWVRREATEYADGLAGFLKQRAVLWHQVGRVCFHLAENRRDADCPFAFLATYAPRLSAGARVQYQPLREALREYAGANDKKALVKLLSPVQLASEKSLLAKELVDSGDLYQALAWTPRQAYRFLKEIPLFEQCGVLVRVPDWWKQRPRPQVRVTIGDKRQNHLDANSMLDFRVKLALGEEELTESEWRELMAADQGLVFLKGQWVEVDRGRLAEALEHWKQVERQAEDGVSFVEGMRLLAGAPGALSDDVDNEPTRAWSFVDAGKWLGQVLRDLRSPDNLAGVAAGDALHATLRKYQETGVAWLAFVCRLGLGACLADDMGLGTTVQVLALLAALQGKRSVKPSLLVVPASLLANWKAEIQRFTPTLRARYVHPSETPKDELDQMAKHPDRIARDTDVVFTTYAMLQRQTWLLDIDWHLAVIDEAQAIKNSAARQTKAVKRIQAHARIALTGTPIENRLSDLWSLFDFLCPGLLGSQQKFKEFVKSLNARQHHRFAPLRQLVQPYILRRLKTDKQVISDLPEKIEVRAHCGLSKRQAVLYTKMVEEMTDALQNLEGMQRRGVVLSYLLRFKQLCNHPSQLLGDGVFRPGDSGKFARLAEICDEIASRQEKSLVFTQFREMTEPLADFLAKLCGRDCLVLHGSVNVKRRKNLVDQFQRDDGPPFFVAVRGST
jgi:non-specific serine/threonine protein kinase